MWAALERVEVPMQQPDVEIKILLKVKVTSIHAYLCKAPRVAFETPQKCA